MQDFEERITLISQDPTNIENYLVVVEEYLRRNESGKQSSIFHDNFVSRESARVAEKI